MNEIVYNTIDKRWQSNLILKDTLVYQVSLNEKGKIIAYKPFNSAAIQEMQKTAHLFQPDTQSPSNSLAQFQVVLSSSGLLEVTPWDGWR